MIAGVVNHLWQSTIFALAAVALAAALRGNRAGVRHWIWVIASVKFLVPFGWLVAAGSQFRDMFPASTVAGATSPVSAAWSLAARQLTAPFFGGEVVARDAPVTLSGWVLIAVLALWACGSLALVSMRLRAWLRIRAAMRQSVAMDVEVQDRPVEVRAAPGLLEPGIVGIRRPVLLLPVGIDRQLTPAQLDSVIAHECCHVQRHDNLLAGIHMVVETVFWFHPIIWWIGARLVEERERACDEHVLTLGVPPRDYADGILNVCRLYVESPIVCVSGVTGSNLKKRIEDIMMVRIGRRLSVTRKLLLLGLAAFAVALPVVSGTVTAVRAQSTTPVPAVGDMASIVKVITDSGAKAADRLVGKIYAGLVVVQAVRLSPGSADARVDALLDGAVQGDGTPKIVLRFAAAADDPRLRQLRKDQRVRLRGTFRGISSVVSASEAMEPKILWVEFTNLVIEDAGGAIAPRR